MIIPPKCEVMGSLSTNDKGLDRFYCYVRSLADNQFNPRMRIYPGLPSTPWLDPSQFPMVEDLEREFEGIRREIFALGHQDFQSESENIRRTGSWDVFFFYELGIKNVENCTRCPLITKIIEGHNTVRSLAGLIYVSKLRPGTHIAPHCASTNMRVRCHLGIKVPQGDCGLKIGGETRQWTEGKCMVFNDHFRHEAWNHTLVERIVLIIDLWHPDLSTNEIALLEGMHRYASANAQHLNRYWSKNEKARRTARMADAHDF
jgi:aspartyl/asparaginyl beta-hydroxylase (cupin superfamily)